MKKLINVLLHSRFLTAFYSITGGVIVAQLLNFAFQPIVGRLYSVEQFGEYAVYTSLLASIGVAIALAYDQAVIGAKDKDEAQRLLFGSIYISAVLSVLVALFCFLFQERLLVWMELERCDWLFLLPVNLFLLCLYNLLTSYGYVLEVYKSLAVVSCLRAAAIGLVQIAVFYLGGAAVGLPLGRVAALVICSGILLYIVKKSRISFQNARPANILGTLKEYYRFPLFQLPASFTSHGIDVVIVFSITDLFTKVDLGMYSLVIQVLQVPISFVSASLRQLSIRELTREGDNTAQAKAFFVKLAASSAILIAIPMAILFVFGERLFLILFGDQWSGIQGYIRALIPLYSGNFIAYALSGVAVVNKRQKEMLIFQIALVAVAVGVYLLAKLLEMPVMMYLTVLSLSGLLVYAVQSVVLYRTIGAENIEKGK